MQKLSTDIIYNYGKVETLVMYQSWDKTDIYKNRHEKAFNFVINHKYIELVFTAILYGRWEIL